MNTPSQVPQWLRTRPNPRRRGLGDASASPQQFVYVPGATVQAAFASAGSTILVLVPDTIGSVNVTNTGAMQSSSSCLKSTGATCPQNVSAVQLTLDGTPGTITVTATPAPIISGQGWSAPPALDPFIINVPGSAAGLVVPTQLHPPSPGTPVPPQGTAPNPNPTAPAAASSTGTVALFAAGAAVVAVGGYLAYRAFGHSASRAVARRRSR